MQEPFTRDRIIEALQGMPPDVTMDDAIERLVFLAKIETGLAELEGAKVFPMKIPGVASDCNAHCMVPIMDSRYSFISMYRDFHALDRWTKKQVHCIYQALIVAVATRHADAVDIKFLVDGRPVWVALPLRAWEEYKKRTDKMITDPLAIAIAGHFLKTALETGEGVGREMYSLTVQQTLEHLDAAVNEPQPASA